MKQWRIGKTGRTRIKNSEKMYILFELVLAVMVLILAFIMLHENNGEDLKKVSVIIPNSDHDQWSAFKYGLRMAAQDWNVEMFVVSIEGALTAEKEQEILEREVENGADAVIVQPVPGKDMGKILKKIEKKIPLLLVEDTVWEDSVSTAIPVTEPDHYGMGRALAEELLQDYNGRIVGKTIGILSEAGGLKAVTERKRGFLEAIADAEANVLWSVAFLPEEDGQKILEKQPRADFLIALDDYSLTTAGTCAAANNLHGALVYGIGNSTEAVYYLDTAVVQCLVLPDAFLAGYQCLTEIAKSLDKIFYQPMGKTVSYTVMRRDSLFAKENQEILFTMSQ